LGHPQAAQRADDGPALDDGEGDRVVDQEHAHYQRQQAERGQVQPEGVGEALHALAAGARLDDRGAGRQDGADAVEQGAADLGPLVGDEVNMAQPTGHVEQLLGGADVHDRQAVQGAPAALVGRVQDAGDAHRPSRVAGPQGERIAQAQSVARCRLLTDEQRVGPDEEVRQIVLAQGGVALPQIAAEWGFGEGVHPQYAQGLLVQLDRDRVGFHHRRGLAHAQLDL
jgi:hypothetical protein